MSLIKHYLHNKMTDKVELFEFLYDKCREDRDLLANIIDRDSLQEAYVTSILDGMDWKTMEQFVYDSLNNNLDDYTVEELITEVKDYYPELLEESVEK
jgi:hypothetical protein